MPTSGRALVCAVTVPDAVLALDELIGQHGGELQAHAPGWLRVAFDEVDAATAFVRSARGVCVGLAAAIHVGDLDPASTAYVARLARGAPPGALWLTGSSAGERPVREVPLHPAFDVVASLDDGEGRRSPAVPRADRAGDRVALDALFAMGTRVVVLEGSSGSGKSRLLREHVLDHGGMVLDGALFDDPWSFVFIMARYLGVPIEEHRGLECAVDRLVAGCAAIDPPLLGLDHVSEPLLEVIRPFLVRTAVRAIVVGVPRIRVRGEVCYQLGPSTAAPVGDGLGDALSESVRRHPLASRILATAAVDSLTALRWMERINADGSRITAVFEGLQELAPPEAFTMLEAMVPAPRLIPSDGLRAASGLAPDAFDRGLAWLLRTGLVEQRREQLWVSSWVEHLQLEPKRRSVLVRAWGAWARERLAPVLDQRGERSLQVLALLDGERALLDALIQGLLNVERVGADDLATLAVLLHARSLHAQAVGPARPLVHPLERALTAVGRSFDVGPDVAISLLVTRARVSGLVEAWGLALADLERAEGLARRLQRRADLDQVLVQRATIHLARGRFDEAEAALLGYRGVAPLGSRVQAAMGAALTAQGRFQEAGEALAQAEAEAGSLLIVEQGHLAASRALWLRRNTRIDEAVVAYGQALRVWRRLGKLHREVITRFRLGTTLQGSGALDDAEAQFLAAEGVARRAGDAARLSLILVQRGLVALERQDDVAARELFLQALSAARSGRDRGAEGTAIGFLALVRQFQGDLDGARENYRIALRNLEIGRERRFGALFHSCLAVTEAQAGNIDEARIMLDVAMLQLPDADQGMGPALGLIESLLELNEAVREGKSDAKTVWASLAEQVEQTDEGTDNVYVRFVRRYIGNMLQDPAWTS